MERTDASDRFPIGSSLPAFSLPDVSGKHIDATYFEGARAALVIFTCNHCPYVKGSDRMLHDIIARYQPEGLKVIAISSNDAAQYPEDSFDKMKEKAAALKFSFPYLYDESQNVAKLFDAACTPECYLFDSGCKLVFHGTISNSPRHPDKVTTDYLSAAVESALAGKKPEPAFVHPIGCSIKWKV